MQPERDSKQTWKLEHVHMTPADISSCWFVEYARIGDESPRKDLLGTEAEYYFSFRRQHERWHFDPSEGL